MKIVLTRLINGKFFQSELTRKSPSSDKALMSSMAVIRNELSFFAAKEFGGSEGTNWRIIPRKDCLIPLLARDSQGDEITIESSSYSLNKI